MRPFAEIFFVNGHNVYFDKTPGWFSRFLHKITSHWVKFALPFIILLNIINVMTRNLEIVDVKRSPEANDSILQGMIFLFHSMNIIGHSVFYFYKNELYSLFNTFRYYTVHSADALIISKHTKRLVFIYHVIWIQKVIYWFWLFCTISPIFGMGIYELLTEGYNSFYEQDREWFRSFMVYTVNMAIVTVLPEFTIPVFGFPYIFMLWARLTLERAKKGLLEVKSTQYARHKFQHFCTVYLEILELMKAFNTIISPCLHALLIFGLLAITYTVSVLRMYGFYQNIKLIILATPLTIMLIKTLSNVFRFNNEVRNYCTIS